MDKVLPVQDAQASSGAVNNLIIKNQAGDMARVLEWLEQTARQRHLSESTVFKLDLVLNEALPNIIDHAYQDHLSHEIFIQLVDKGDHIVLEIVDDGVAYNPFAHHSFQISSSLDSSSINGRGIHLIKSFTDGQEYLRIDHTNVMRVSILKTPEEQKRYRSAFTTQ